MTATSSMRGCPTAMEGAMQGRCKKPHGDAFEGAGSRTQMTEADVIAMFAPQDGDT